MHHARRKFHSNAPQRKLTNQQVKHAPLVPHTCNSDRFAKPLRTKQWCGPNVASRRACNTTCARRPSQAFRRIRSRLTIKYSACSSFQPSSCGSAAAFQQSPRRVGDRAAISTTSLEILRSHRHATTDKTSSAFEQVPRRVKNSGQGVVYFFAVLAQLFGHHQALNKHSLWCLFASGLSVKPSPHIHTNQLRARLQAVTKLQQREPSMAP